MRKFNRVKGKMTVIFDWLVAARTRTTSSHGRSWVKQRLLAEKGGKTLLSCAISKEGSPSVQEVLSPNVP